MRLPVYGPQVVQLEEPQLLQEPPVPDIGVLNPDSFLEKEEQTETIRLAFLLHLGQAASLFDSLNEHNNSNLVPQSEQTYSYIGIFHPPIIILWFLGIASQAGAVLVLFGYNWYCKALLATIEYW